MKILLYLSISALFISSCQTQKSTESLYFGGTILTMEDSSPQVEAVVVKNGKIFLQDLKLKPIIM
ncbi:hypothetical protein [Chryseobacterium indoltheticum]|uniref:hypothetical protein n=1 Tax=Chryseobacterium indoltheticum TaxID=254 RepID=UPI003F49721D